MLSRRNVRIKIMQVLYAAQRQGIDKPQAYDALLMNMVRNSFKVYLQNLLIIQRVAEYARHDKATRQAKLRPTKKDLAFDSVLAENRCVRSLSDNHELSRLYEEYGVKATIDADQIKKLYRDFTKTEEHAAYLAIHREAKARNTTPDPPRPPKSAGDASVPLPPASGGVELPLHLRPRPNMQPQARVDTQPPVATTTDEQDIEVLLKLYKFLQKQELFLNMVEDHFPLWPEDKSLVIGAIKKTLKAMPLAPDFYQTYKAHGEAVSDFGRPLLKFIVESDQALVTRIEPRLNNWTAERVALVDMILLKMALAEFTQFPGIAPQVTINEYVDISKSYSTDKSREFINGVLDGLRKELEAEGLV